MAAIKLPFLLLSSSTRLPRKRIHLYLRGLLLLTLRGRVSGVIQPQLAATNRHTRELFPGRSAGLDISKVGMRKATWPTSGTVNGDAHIGHVLQLTENPVQLSIGRLVGDVANVQRLGGLSNSPGTRGGLSRTFRHLDTAAMPERVVGALDGLVPRVLGVEPDKTVSV